MVLVLALTMLAAGYLWLSLVIIGEPVDGLQLNCQAVPAGEQLRVQISVWDSATALRGWQLRQEGRDLYLRGRKVLASGFFREGSYETFMDVKEIDRVYLGGRIICQREA